MAWEWPGKTGLVLNRSEGQLSQRGEVEIVRISDQGCWRWSFQVRGEEICGCCTVKAWVDGGR